MTSTRRLLIDVGVVEFKRQGKTERRFFVNCAGVGFDAAVVEAVERLPKFFGGTIPYVLGLLRCLFGYKSKSVVLKVGRRLETKSVLSVVVANGCYFGGGMRMAPQAELSDSLLDVLTIGDMGKFEFLKTFPMVYKGTHITHPKVSMEKASQIKIESQEPFLVHADGELLGEGPVSFWLVPSALSIVV